MAGQIEDSLLFFVGQDRAAGQPIEKWLKIGIVEQSHDALPALQAGALSISQPPIACWRNDR
jgi:hypothetical protein